MHVWESNVLRMRAHNLISQKQGKRNKTMQIQATPSKTPQDRVASSKFKQHQAEPSGTQRNPGEPDRKRTHIGWPQTQAHLGTPERNLIVWTACACAVLGVMLRLCGASTWRKQQRRACDGRLTSPRLEHKRRPSSLPEPTDKLRPAW